MLIRYRSGRGFIKLLRPTCKASPLFRTSVSLALLMRSMQPPHRRPFSHWETKPNAIAMHILRLVGQGPKFWRWRQCTASIYTASVQLRSRGCSAKTMVSQDSLPSRPGYHCTRRAKCASITRILALGFAVAVCLFVWKG